MTAVFVITPKNRTHDITWSNGSIWGREKHIRRLKQKHWIDFHH